MSDLAMLGSAAALIVVSVRFLILSVRNSREARASFRRASATLQQIEERLSSPDPAIQPIPAEVAMHMPGFRGAMRSRELPSDEILAYWQAIVHEGLFNSATDDSEPIELWLQIQTHSATGSVVWRLASRDIRPSKVEQQGAASPSEKRRARPNENTSSIGGLKGRVSGVLDRPPRGVHGVPQPAHC